MKYKRIGIMCGSSEACPQHFLDMAFSLGEALGSLGHEIIYGGGAKGLMRKVADGALAKGARVDGYMPEFMVNVEWQHNKLTHLHMTKNMAERKTMMRENSDATLFLPGGCGTMEEFFEWMTCKRLGMYTGPLVIVNYQGYYDPLIALLENMQKEKFHGKAHDDMWSVANSLEDLSQVLEDAPAWSADAIKMAAVQKQKP
ncbi:MAG: TIGR00730 family Rossman fold protein [Bacteriovoracaceae bacterium]